MINISETEIQIIDKESVKVQYKPKKGQILLSFHYKMEAKYA